MELENDVWDRPHDKTLINRTKNSQSNIETFFDQYYGWLQKNQNRVIQPPPKHNSTQLNEQNIECTLFLKHFIALNTGVVMVAKMHKRNYYNMKMNNLQFDSVMIAEWPKQKVTHFCVCGMTCLKGSFI